MTAQSALLLAAVGTVAENPTIRASPCFDSAPAYGSLAKFQQFSFVSPGQVTAVSGGGCLTASTAAGSASLGMAPCGTGGKTQTWTGKPTSDHNYTGLALSSGGGNMNVGPMNALVPGAPLMLGKGHGAIVYDGSVFRLSTGNPGFNRLVCKDCCLTFGPAARPCDARSPAAGFPMCDPARTLDARLDDLVQRIPSTDKAKLLVNIAGGVADLWIPPTNWWSEALHGVQTGGSSSVDGMQHDPTCFPSAITSAASFNASLFFAVGSAIGTEARALGNVGQADGWTFWSPNLNVFRDPRWGRGQETPGEDPVLNGMYGANFIAGFQGDAAAPANGTAAPPPPLGSLKSSSCAKHFFAYSLENCFVFGDNCRLNFNAELTQQEIEDTYLPAFQSAVELGRVSGLMCSYNAVNGVPACADEWSMTTVAREAWKFDGYVTSDCGAVAHATLPYPTSHPWTKTTEGGHGLKTPPGKSLASAGLDNNCNLQGGTIGGNDTDQALALKHLFAVQYRLGIFDATVDVSPWNALDEQSVGPLEHQQLALDAARQGHVLLKNDQRTLPLDAAKAKKVALIGPTWDVLKGGYSNGGTGGAFTIDTSAAIAAYVGAGAVSSFAGCADPQSQSGKRKSSAIDCAANDQLTKAATAAAAASDAVLVAVGIDGSFEGENGDFRAITGDIGLPGAQGALVAAVAAAAKAPITVLVTGSSVDLAALKANPKVGAILWRGYAGEAGGQATADVLFGEHNPDGRLTSTFYPQAFVDAWKPAPDPYVADGVVQPRNASYFDHHTRPNATSGNPGRTYRFYQDAKNASYIFGDGLSYTSFGHALASPARVNLPLSGLAGYAVRAAARKTFRRDAPLASVVHTADVTVTNTGDRAGAQAVLAFMAPPNPGVDGAPLRSLVGFGKVFLQPGESAQVSLAITQHDLTLTPIDGGRAAAVGDWVLTAEGTTTTFRVRDGESKGLL